MNKANNDDLQSIGVKSTELDEMTLSHLIQKRRSRKKEESVEVVSILKLKFEATIESANSEEKVLPPLTNLVLSDLVQ